MTYLDTNSKSVSPTSNERFQPLGRQTTLFGLFIGFVKNADDVQKNGRLQVWIPDLGSVPEDSQGWITVNYCSPFAGATNVDTISKSDIKTFEGTQTSYGMWMIPPDINNEVAIMFVGGDPSKGIWLGCLYNQFMNQMVPGMAVDTKNWQYNGKAVPTAEYNKWDKSVTQPDNAYHPYQKTKFLGLGNQGLIRDQGRGITTSSARREAPSNVFGIITPGPAIDEAVPAENIRRKGGSSFIMDDGTGTEYVQLTTKSGAQIRLDETNGFVYLINRDGTAWVQMDQQGNIDIFGATNISMRAQRDVNIRADRNINFEAGQNIYMKAAKDTVETTTSFTYDVNNIPKKLNIPYWKYVGEGLGDGGNIVIQSLNNMHTTISKNTYLKVGLNQEIVVGSTIDISSGSGYNLSSTTIKNVGDVQIKGTLEVTDNVQLGNSLQIKNSINADSLSLSGNIIAGTITGNFPGLNPGGGANTGGPGTAGTTVTVSSPPSVVPAEVKPTLDKINILATWADPESKFKRNAQSVNTIVTRLPTYEPAPEHEQFSFASIAGYSPNLNDGDKTYEGSGGAGNTVSTSPQTNTTPGANNTDIIADTPIDSAIAKDFNMKAYECQLKIHEGVKYVSYLDSVGLPTGGIGHLLRQNEVSQYPVPTAIVESQVTSWFNQDAPTSIKGAQTLIGIDVWGDLSDIRKRACADLCYNLGQSRLSKFTKFISSMKANDFNAAGDSLRNSKWFTQVGRRGPNIITMIVNNIDPNGCDRRFPA